MAKFIKKITGTGKKKPEPIPEKNETQAYGKIFSEKELEGMQISDSLTENIEKLFEITGKSSDLIIKDITLGRSEAKPAAVIYVDNLIDSKLIDEEVIRPLVLDAYTSGLNTGKEIIRQIQSGNLLTRGQTNINKNFKKFLDEIFAGNTGILIDGVNEAYTVNSQGYEHRNVDEPTVEPVVQGPKEAFIEVLSINIGLIRKRIHSPNLVVESMEIGKIGRTKVCMLYLKGICSVGLSDEVRSRLKKISIDGVLESGYIEEFIQDNPFSIFPQIRNTERPDIAASALLEGRVAVIIDNTPVILIVPGEFFSLLQSAEDYYNRYSFSSLVRLLRYFAFTLAILLPAFYIAITDYHQEMLPTGLLISIISARALVPFPAFIEALIMEITFEILREAGIRLPRPMGQAVSIVGALVIGQAAVQANIVSPLMVIVVALTGIATFCIPQYNITLPIRVLRFTLMIMAVIFGLFGVMIGILFIMLHLFSLESFGKPYMSPLSPLRTGDLKDTIVRFPWWALVRRPEYSSLDSRRMQPGQVPQPPKKGGRKQ